MEDRFDRLTWRDLEADQEVLLRLILQQLRIMDEKIDKLLEKTEKSV